MPCAKYYRSLLPHDLLMLVGSFAGDRWNKLEFTYSPKRRFISRIKIVPRFNYMLPPLRVRILTKNSWKPVTLGDYDIMSALMRELSSNYLRIFNGSIKQIQTLLCEIHNYTIRP